MFGFCYGLRVATSPCQRRVNKSHLVFHFSSDIPYTFVEQLLTNLG